MASDRFLQLKDVGEVLDISSSQTYALVRSGELPAIKIGGRGQWRVERTALETYIRQAYTDTAAFVAAHPLGSAGDPVQPPDVDEDASVDVVVNVDNVSSTPRTHAAWEGMGRPRSKRAGS